MIESPSHTKKIIGVLNEVGAVIVGPFHYRSLECYFLPRTKAALVEASNISDGREIALLKCEFPDADLIACLSNDVDIILNALRLGVNWYLTPTSSELKVQYAISRLLSLHSQPFAPPLRYRNRSECEGQGAPNNPEWTLYRHKWLLCTPGGAQIKIDPKAMTLFLKWFSAEDKILRYDDWKFVSQDDAKGNRTQEIKISLLLGKIQKHCIQKYGEALPILNMPRIGYKFMAKCTVQ